MSVSQTILDQLGGRRFLIMTGAKDFTGDGKSLTMRLPSNLTKARITHFRVTLTPMDEYLVATLKTSRKTGVPEVVESLDGVYCDNLEEVFTSMTGLYLRF